METINFLPYYHQLNTKKAESSYTSQTIMAFLERHFGRESASITINGRRALACILEGLNLKREDEICIFTTFDFPNVSSCVTSTVFNFCKPSRVFSSSTKAVIVIHEFGVPYNDINNLAIECGNRGIPLIEDCAHTIDSILSGVRVGTTGDWVIGSFPKIFPVLAGGFLLGKSSVCKSSNRQINEIENISTQIAPFLNQLDNFSSLRRTVYQHLTEYANSLGLKPVFEVTNEITPWFFPLQVPDLEKTFEAASLSKVECALWHGTNIIIFPCHQFISEEHIDRITNVIRSGLPQG